MGTEQKKGHEMVEEGALKTSGAASGGQPQRKMCD